MLRCAVGGSPGGQHFSYGPVSPPVFVMVDATDMPVGVRKDIHIKFASYSPPRKRKNRGHEPNTLLKNHFYAAINELRASCMHSRIDAAKCDNITTNISEYTQYSEPRSQPIL